MEKYKKYFDEVRQLFTGSYESAGGQEFRYYHSLNVANIAKLLADKSGLSPEDREISVLAAIFHDISKYLRTQEGGFLDASHAFEQMQGLESHEIQSSKMVEKYLSEDFSDAVIAGVQKTIACHGNPETEPEKVLYDADELSEMGAMNLWKMFTYSSYKKRDLAKTINYWFETDRERHFEKMSRLFLDESKRQAQKRIDSVDLILGDLRDQLIEA